MQATAVQVSDVTYKYFKGTCARDIAIKLDCDELVNCHNIVMEHINITSSSSNKLLTAYCQYADVVSHFVSTDIKCGSDEEPKSPTQSPEPPVAVEPPTPYSQPPVPAKPPTSFPQPPTQAMPPTPISSDSYTVPSSIAPSCEASLMGFHE